MVLPFLFAFKNELMKKLIYFFNTKSDKEKFQSRSRALNAFREILENENILEYEFNESHIIDDLHQDLTEEPDTDTIEENISLIKFFIPCHNHEEIIGDFKSKFQHTLKNPDIVA